MEKMFRDLKVNEGKRIKNLTRDDVYDFIYDNVQGNYRSMVAQIEEAHVNVVLGYFNNVSTHAFLAAQQADDSWTIIVFKGKTREASADALAQLIKRA